MGGDVTPLAHGIGGRQDLPVPLETAIIAAVAALVISFVVLAWTVRRQHGAVVSAPAPADTPVGVGARAAGVGTADPGTAAGVGDAAGPAPTRRTGRSDGFVARIGALVDSTGWRAALRVVGLLFFAYTVMVSVFGQDLEINPVFGIFYIWWWVGLVPLSLLFGPVWKAVSPVRTINAGLNWLRRDDEGLYEYDEARIGYWPAVVGLLAFTWMELIYPHNSYLGPVRLWMAIYLAVMLIGGQLWGERFYENADPFEVYSSLVAKLSVWGRDGEGRLEVRSPLTNLDTLMPHTGLVAVVSVLFGTIVFDSFREAVPWLKFTQGDNIVARHAYVADNVALLAFPLAVGVFFCVGTMLTGVGEGFDRRRLPGLLAPSVVPIVVGYVVAHYMSYWWEGGQATLVQVSDPFSNGANWFGTGDLKVDYFFAYHPTLLANLKVLAVVVGHILGVMSSHRRAIAVLPRRHMVTGQIPLLVTMIGFTVGGLYLLFAA
ncbi:hypothetical protein P5P86_06530 [Nocardioides sp. BP30]|uniref:hypothetical protein n=1 Tax=Nocardioides sp. BP30 TaxID=3036374 RepID=UPI002468761C|nr:hypothetical protein [Nocardioides sp. BP30]WGL53484.1 hypothetical protein P5P86_06530 [Nocardioides sp. BP30]